MMLRESNINKHKEVLFNLWKKKGIWEDMTHTKLAETSNSVSAVAILNGGLNPYKMVEMFKNYRLYVPDQFQLDELFAKPSVEVWAKVKTEKIDQAEFRKKLKLTKYSDDKERLEMVIDKGEGIDKSKGMAQAGGRRRGGVGKDPTEGGRGVLIFG